MHLQTQQEGKISIVHSTVGIIRKQGILALYNGLSASLLRQLTYSTIRFGAYEVSTYKSYICYLYKYHVFLNLLYTGHIVEYNRSANRRLSHLVIHYLFIKSCCWLEFQVLQAVFLGLPVM